MDALRKRRLARRYARALLDVATAERIDVDLVERELAAFAGAVQGDPVVGRILSSPRLSRHQERATIEAVASRIGVSRLVARLLRVLADRRRLTLLPDVLACYRERLWERRRIARARVTTAVPLDERQRRAVVERLTAATGRTVHVQADVDPSIIGGIVAEVDGTVYDGSVKGQLARLKRQLERAPVPQP